MENNLKHICYIIGAYKGDEAIISPNKGDLVIAADGGYKSLDTLGINSDFVVGDFDSLGFVPQAENIIWHPVRKDDSDTLLAIRLGLEQGYKNFVITGALGGRLDHSFANLQTLLFIRNNGARGLLYGNGTVVTTVYNKSLTLKGEGTLSIFTMDEKALGVTLKDVSYPLENAELTNHFPIGVSNEFIGRPAEISCTDGTLFVFCQAHKNSLPEIVRMIFNTNN